MALWQMLSISLVIGFGVASFMGFAWWYLRRFHSDALQSEASNLLDKAKDKSRPTMKTENQLLCRMAQDIISTVPAAELLPERLRDAAQAARERAAGEHAKQETSESLLSNDASEAFQDLSEEGIESGVSRDPFLLSTDFKELRLKDLLGCGGFGRVQLVEELHSNTVPPPTAVWKALDKTYMEKSGMRWNMLTEKRIFAVTKLCPSPFIVSYHGCCQTPRYVYFKTEALLGGELFQTYKKNQFHGMEDKARYYIASAMTAIRHLHTLQVMLRSLKPEDCGLALDGTLKIFDFGLSKFVVDKTFTTCGTPDYFCPEIIAARGHAFPVDWWCCGVMLFEMLTSHPPFESATPMQIYQKVMNGINKVSFPGEVSSSAKNLICSLCNAEPSARLPAAKGFEALQSHAFFKNFDWGGLSSMAPPYVPDPNVKNYSATEEDLPACFKSSGPEVTGEFWTSHFGSMGEDNEFPCVM